MELNLEGESITHLLTLWAQGDDGARGDVFARIYDKLHKAARSLGNDAEASTLISLIHDVFLRLSESEAQLFRDRTHFAAVCVRTLRSVLVDRHRRQEVRDRYVQTGITPEMPDSPMDSNLLDVQRAIADLSLTRDADADAITLRHWGGLSDEEIAQESDCSLATVGRRIKFAKFYLSARLHEYQVG